ncbi:MAG: tRNA pseudouridine(55) synthase TruB [Desulfobacterales bacterium]|nr:tRNA pseudouridine(55) synthase TruB [Desulfobacterales bacterium]
MPASFETKKRPGLSGILILDKPEGLSSAQAVGRVKKLLGARKAGHAGTLDPFATGVLVCMLNQATRLGRFLLAGEKTYAAVLRLGITTDTQDGTGQVVAQQPVGDGIENRLVEVFRRFEGDIAQTPPAYSALKHQGVPLYKLARRGQPVHKPPRQVRIAALQIETVELPDVHFRVTCSAGTYIRSLCADIGQALRCGGHLSQLRRTHSSGFGIETAIGLAALEKRVRAPRAEVPLISPAAALPGMETLVADEETTLKISNGGRLTLQDLPVPDPQGPAGQGSDDRRFYKVIDSHDRLWAIVTFRPQEKLYAYCCVFPVTAAE